MPIENLPQMSAGTVENADAVGVNGPSLMGLGQPVSAPAAPAVTTVPTAPDAVAPVESAQVTPEVRAEPTAKTLAQELQEVLKKYL